MNFRLWATVVALMACTAQVVSGDPKDQAKRHFEQAEAYFRAKTYDKAAAEYDAAFQLARLPVLLFNAALSHENAGNETLALSYYDRYLTLEPRGVKSTEARARREALSRKLAAQKRDQERARSIAAHKSRAREHRAAGRFSRAAVELESAYLLSKEPDLVFHIAEHHRRAGSRNAALESYQRYLGLDSNGAYRAQAQRRIDELEINEPRGVRIDRKTTQVQQAPRRRSLVPSIVAFAVAGASVGVAIGFGRKATNIKNELDDELMVGTPPVDSRDGRFDDGKSAAVVANVAFGVSAASAIVATVLLVRALRVRQPVTVSPEVGARSGGVTVGVVF